MTAGIDRRSVRFPGSGHIWIPCSGRRAAAAGLSMHSPCAPVKVLAQRALYVGVRILGPRLIPGERAMWRTPLPDDEWTTVLQAWREAVGEFDSLAMYLRPQAGRTGFAGLLLDRGRAVAFARVQPDKDRIEREHLVMSQLSAARPSSFRVARPIAKGEVDGSGWMLTSSVPNYPLGAVRSARTRRVVSAELSDILLGVLDRPAGVPSHWMPAHGDFSPWNLRTELSRAVRVIDWEDTGFAPPGTDLLYGALTAHATFGGPLPGVVPDEAADWIEGILIDRIRRDDARAEDLTDANAALLRTLRGLPRRQ